MEEKTFVEELLKPYEKDLRNLSRQIYNHPELGLEEHRAKTWQVDLLRAHGFHVEENFCGFSTAFKASFSGEKEGPSLCFLSEYDALPELGHGCGHNLIAMVGVGSALGAKELLKDRGGSVTLIGTPAEETAGTKVPMSKAGVFNDFDVVMMAHPAFMNADALNTYAMDAYEVEFFGKKAHAAASPEEGINALDAMILFFNSLGLLRQQLSDKVRLHGIITHGGDAANIIPDYTSASLYLRAPKVKEVKNLAKRVEKMVEGAALQTGCSSIMKASEENFKDTVSNRTLSELAASATEVFTPEPLVRTEGTLNPGSSDLGDVSYEVPAIQMLFKIGEYPDPEGGFHTEYFVEAAGSLEAEENALHFTRGFMLTSKRLLEDPKHLEAIRKEFERKAQDDKRDGKGI